jgi:hypothetical protein
MFGLVLEKHIGSLRFIIIYFISGMVGNTLQAILYPDFFVLGASGSLFGIIGALLMRQPLLSMRIFGIIKCPLIILFGGFFALSSFLEKLSLTGGNVSGDVAHLFGFLTGIFITAVLFKESIDVFYNWIIVFFGFFLIRIAIENLISISNYPLMEILRLLAIVIAGLILILYSYINLRNHLTNRGELQ